MNSPGYHEVHLRTFPRSLKLARLRQLLPDLRPNLACDPRNIPPRTLCYEYPSGRESEFNQIADKLGMGYEWGIGGNTFVACFALGNLLFSVTQNLNTLVITNIADPTSSVGISVTGLSHTPTAVWVYLSVCYIACSDGALIVVNVDNPASPSVIQTISNSGQNWAHLFMIGGIAFTSGPSSTGVGLFTADEDNSSLYQFFMDPIAVGTSQSVVSGRRVFFADSTIGPNSEPALLRSFRLGGSSCPWIISGSIAADLMQAEEFVGRDVTILGEMVCHGATAAFSGDLSVAHVIKLGTKSLFWSNTVADPNGSVTADFSSLFLASDGSVWRNSDGGTTWVAM